MTILESFGNTGCSLACTIVRCWLAPHTGKLDDEAMPAVGNLIIGIKEWIR